MAKYYNAETLLEFVKQNTPNFNSETTMQCVERAIKEAPTADVAEIKQGEWIICCDGYYPYCSLCGYEPIRPLGNYDNRTPYCPNCGAKMRKEWEGI